jgi:hypothetical protein
MLIGSHETRPSTFLRSISKSFYDPQSDVAFDVMETTLQKATCR